MAIKYREYLASIDKFKKPRIINGESAVGILLLRLLLLEPGSDPLHPDMGVAIRKFRYSMEDELEALNKEISEQMSTYLPDFNADVKLTPNPDKTLKVEITIDETVYELDTSVLDNKISLDSLK